MRILSSREGVPELPASNRAILVAGTARHDLALAMAEADKECSP